MKAFFCVGIILSFSLALGIEYIPLKPEKSHLDFNLERGPFHLEFFKSKNLKEKSEIELNGKGLFVSGKQVCTWPNNKFESKNSPNMVLIEVKTTGPCREVSAIRSTWGDGGIGTAVLTIEVFKMDGAIATISYRGVQLYTSLENHKGKFKFHLPGKLSNTAGD